MMMYHLHPRINFFDAILYSKGPQITEQRKIPEEEEEEEEAFKAKVLLMISLLLLLTKLLLQK